MAHLFPKEQEEFGDRIASIFSYFLLISQESFESFIFQHFILKVKQNQQ